MPGSLCARSRGDALSSPRAAPLGDAGITLTFGAEISRELSEQAVRQAAAIREAAISGVTDVVPSYAAVTIFYDPLTIGFGDLSERLRAVTENRESGSIVAGRANTAHRIPVKYDGADLESVARRTGLTVDDVIRIHSSGEYRVFVIGFVPGFAYLGPLDERLVLPRRESPRTRVPAGSVAIAEAQTGVYPAATPGGWHILGTTSTLMFHPEHDPPSLLQVGDLVTFVPAP
jgi:inhibitor of KinA